MITWDYRFLLLYRGTWVMRLFCWVSLFVLMLCFTVCFRDWFITTGLVCPKFENDDDDGNASAIFLSPLGLCLYDDTYALLSSPGLISSSSVFVLHALCFHGLRRYPMFCLCFCDLLLPTSVLLCFFVCLSLIPDLGD